MEGFAEKSAKISRHELKPWEGRTPMFGRYLPRGIIIGKTPWLNHNVAWYLRWGSASHPVGFLNGGLLA